MIPAITPSCNGKNRQQIQSAWEVCFKAAADGGWVVIQEFEGATDCISLIMDGIRRRSAVRRASTAAAEGQEKLLREQQVAGKTTATRSTMKTSRDDSNDDSPAAGGLPSNGATTGAQQAGGSGGTGAAPAAARVGGVVARRVGVPGGARKMTTSVSRMSPKRPLFKALSAGEGGAMSTRAQPVSAAALR